MTASIELDSRIEELEHSAFWTTRPALVTIHQAAKAGLAQPWAVLAGCLARAAVMAPPAVTLPPVGGYGAAGTVNQLVAISGMPGDGKGLSDGIAARLLPFTGIDRPREADYGSYEGMLKLFGENRRDAETKRPVWHWTARNVFVVVSEVDKLTGTAGRQGDMSTSLFRQAFSGEQLGAAYADPVKAVQIERGTYRLCCIVHVQPPRAQALFESAGGGLLQRFLWAPAWDRNAAPCAPPATALRLPAATAWSSRPTGHITVPPSVSDEILAARLARVRQEVPDGGQDAHGMYIRLKVAASLAFLDQRVDITVEDWALAGIVLEVSTLTRQDAEERLAAAKQDAATERGVERGVERISADQTADSIRGERITRSAARFLAKMGEFPPDHAHTEGWFTQWVAVSKNAASARPSIRASALNQLEAGGWVEMLPGELNRYRLTAAGVEAAKAPGVLEAATAAEAVTTA